MTHALAFFGAFNPPSIAHLNLAEFAMKQADRKTVVFVPSKSVYIQDEQGKDFAYADEKRLEMLLAASQSRPWMTVCNWEIQQPKQPRTYETLCHLRDKGIQASLLIGSDKLAELEYAWLHVPDIAEEFGIVCLSRGADDCLSIIQGSPFLQTLSSHIQILDTPKETKSVSSTQIRHLVTQRKQINDALADMVPAEILTLLEN